MQLRLLTPLLDWKRCSCSQSSSFSGICIVRSNNSVVFGCSVQFVILFDTFFISFEISSIFLACCCRNPPCLRKCNLFLSRKIDQLRMLSRLSLDFTATGYTLYFMSAVLRAFSIVVRVPSFKRTGQSQRVRLCFRMKRR